MFSYEAGDVVKSYSLILFLSTDSLRDDILTLASVMAPPPAPANKNTGSASSLVPQWVAQQFCRLGLFYSSHVNNKDGNIKKP